MTTIEYDNIVINVPESWADVTLGTYEQVYKDRPETSRERVALVAKVCGVEPELLLGWPADIFNTIVPLIGFIFGDNPIEANPVVTAGGVNYIVAVEDELALGAWIDADEAQKAESGVISTVLAIVCRPAGEDYDYKNNEARAAMFAALPMTEVLGVMAFFLRCKIVLNRHTQIYSSLAEAVALLPLNIRPLRSAGGGIRLLRIWPILKYYALMRLLRYQLRRHSHFYSTLKTKKAPKVRSVN